MLKTVLSLGKNGWSGRGHSESRSFHSLFLSTPLSLKLSLSSDHSKMWLFFGGGALPQHVPDSLKVSEPLRAFQRKVGSRNEQDM